MSSPSGRNATFTIRSARECHHSQFTPEASGVTDQHRPSALRELRAAAHREGGERFGCIALQSLPVQRATLEVDNGAAIWRDGEHREDALSIETARDRNREVRHRGWQAGPAWVEHPANGACREESKSNEPPRDGRRACCALPNGTWLSGTRREMWISQRVRELRCGLEPVGRELLERLRHRRRDVRRHRLAQLRHAARLPR